MFYDPLQFVDAQGEATTELYSVVDGESVENMPLPQEFECRTACPICKRLLAADTAQYLAHAFVTQHESLRELTAGRREESAAHVELVHRGQPLKNLARDGHSHTGHGAVRFPGRFGASKWAQVPRDADVSDVIALLCSTWQLSPPQAVISITGAAVGDIPALSGEEREVFTEPVWVQ